MKILKYLIKNMEKRFITIRDTSDNLIALNINAIKYLEAHITKEGEMLTKINGEFGDTESFFVKKDIGEIVDYMIDYGKF